MSERCEVPLVNPTSAEIRDILTGARVIWMKEGLADNAAAAKARAAGLRVVMSRCILKEHRALSA